MPDIKYRALQDVPTPIENKNQNFYDNCIQLLKNKKSLVPTFKNYKNTSRDRYKL